MNLIGDDYYIAYEIGTNALQGGPAPGAFAPLVVMTTSGQATFTRTRPRANVESVNVMGGGDEAKRMRFYGRGNDIDIEGMVSSQLGFQFLNYAGYFIRITFTPHSVLVEPTTVVGVILTAEAEGRQGSAQSETVSINLNPDYAS